MKKLCIIMFTIFFSFCMGAAYDPASGPMGNFIVLNDVISVELIEYDNPSAKTINTFFSCSGEKTAKKLPSFDFDKMKLLEVLEESKLEDFLEAVLLIEAVVSWVHLNSPIGICIKLNREQDFIIISYGEYYGKSRNIMCSYDISGKPLEYFFEPYGDEFKEVINTFFVMQID